MSEKVTLFRVHRGIHGELLLVSAEAKKGELSYSFGNIRKTFNAEQLRAFGVQERWVIRTAGFAGITESAEAAVRNYLAAHRYSLQCAQRDVEKEQGVVAEAEGFVKAWEASVAKEEE